MMWVGGMWVRHWIFWGPLECRQVGKFHMLMAIVSDEIFVSLCKATFFELHVTPRVNSHMHSSRRQLRWYCATWS